MEERAVAAAVAACVGAAALADPAAQAASGSIVYRKAGRLWVAGPDGKRARAIPRTRGMENPSQDDRGLIVAQRGTMLHRVDRRGRARNRPFTTPFRTSSLLPAVKGPFWPEVSPDGRHIAYTYSLTASSFDPACSCYRVTPSLNTTFTRADRPTQDPAPSLGLSRRYSKASWIDNRRVLMTTESLYDFAGNVLDPVAIDTLGGGRDSYARWFAECLGCESLQTLELYPLDEGEMARTGDRMAFVAGPLNSRQPGSELFLYPLPPGTPPAIPQHFCRVTGPNGRFSSPTWSPDGRSLAWADARGIWIGEVGDLSGETCQVTRRLAIPGGTSPDWGRARR